MIAHHAPHVPSPSSLSVSRYKFLYCARSDLKRYVGVVDRPRCVDSGSTRSRSSQSTLAHGASTSPSSKPDQYTCMRDEVAQGTRGGQLLVAAGVTLSRLV